MVLYGLIGYPIGHSFSRKFFNEKFAKEGIDAHYDNFPMENVDDLKAIVASHPNLRGINVTSPHKIAVMSLLDKICGDAAEIGAVNTIKVNSDGLLNGYNTDVGGFKDTITEVVEHRNISRALVLGSGGASKAVTLALTQLGVAPIIVSRRGREGYLTYSDIDKEIIESVGLIVNATPVGMGKLIGEAPEIDYCLISKRHYCYDLIYNPTETEFLRRCRLRGAEVTNGMAMLKAQALRSYKIWTDGV